MAARLTDRQKKKIVADYLEFGSYNATAKRNGVSNHTVKRIVLAVPGIADKINQKKAENTADILDYMEKKRSIVCEIIGKGLEALNDPAKLAEASPAQITTALGTLIDKWTPKGSAVPGKDEIEDDPITRSLKEDAADGLL